MNNKVKILGIIVIVAVIGVTFIACGDSGSGGDAKLKIVNNYSAVITEVNIMAAGNYFDFENENIAANGGTKTFSIDLGKNVPSATGWITITANGLGTVYNGTPGVQADPAISIVAGKTTTVTLTSAGTLTAQNP